MNVKRGLVCLLALLFALTLASCEAKEKEEEPNQNPWFCGCVLEKYEECCVVEVTDAGDQGLQLGDLIVVRTAIDDCPDFAAGDILRVEFNGEIAETYPMQVNHVLAIERVES